MKESVTVHDRDDSIDFVTLEFCVNYRAVLGIMR